MKWYSVKKYKPYDERTCFATCIDGAGKMNLWLCCYDEDDNEWYLVDDSLDKSNNDKLKDIDFKITHFCIPDPVEIEE
jgi:hypothetical protein